MSFLFTFININSFIINSNKPNIIKNTRSNIMMFQELSYDPSKLINSLAKTSDNLDKWNINQFLTEIKNNHIESVSLIKNPITNTINAVVAIDNNYDSKLPDIYNLHYLETGIDKLNTIIVDKLINSDIYYNIIQLSSQNLNQIKNQNQSPIDFILNGIFFYFIITFLFSLFPRFGGSNGLTGMNNPMDIGKIKSQSLIDSDDIKTTFNDVAGCDEAKYELQEIVEFLKNPQQFESAGAKIPKGVLLEGPPGTGKTLLARAVAGEANVAFIQVSASEFIQMFVGVGASRVRELFNLAKKNTPCVVFIDEIDAVGRKRGEQFGGGGNEEREQTLNQILTNMDGFEKTDSIVVLAATNRADILDSALTRSGRFDRKVRVGLPDLAGRRKILDIHLRDKSVDNSTNLNEIASLMGGFSGADIENLANEAAILAIRQNSTVIDSQNLFDAYEKIVIGLPILSKEIDKDEETLVSYHEAGHTLTALLFKEFYDVKKVTINANTNGAGGYTLFTPKEKYMQYPTKKYLLSNLIVTMGGRAAEILLFNKILNKPKNLNYDENKIFNSFKDLDITSGASQDLKQADKLARQYIELFGIDIIDQDLTKIIQNPDTPYLTLSENTKSEIDIYVTKLNNFALENAINILESNMYLLNDIAKQLCKTRSIGSSYLEKIAIDYF